MSINSTGLATNANVPGVAKTPVTADQPAPVPPVYTATSRRANLLPPSPRTNGSDISAPRQEAAAMESRDNIGKQNV